MNHFVTVGEPVTFYARHMSDALELERFGGGRSLWLELQRADMVQQMFKAVREAGLIHFGEKTGKDGSVTIYATLSVNKLESVPRETFTVFPQSVGKSVPRETLEDE
jgi:hypothetical protein